MNDIDRYKQELTSTCVAISRALEAKSIAELGEKMIDALSFKMDVPTDVYGFEYTDGDEEAILKADMSAFETDDGFAVYFTIENESPNTVRLVYQRTSEA